MKDLRYAGANDSLEHGILLSREVGEGIKPRSGIRKTALRVQTGARKRSPHKPITGTEKRADY